MKESTIPIVVAIAAIASSFAIPGVKERILKEIETTAVLQEEVNRQAVSNAQAELQKQKLETETKYKEELLGIEAANADRSNLIAIQRYKGNCRSPRFEDGTGIVIREGMKLLDPSTGLSLQPGTPVCDSSGNTGLIDNDGIVTQFARLRDTPKAVLPKETFERYFLPVKPATVKRKGVERR